jgi:hypothetical protein
LLDYDPRCLNIFCERIKEHHKAASERTTLIWPMLDHALLKYYRGLLDKAVEDRKLKKEDLEKAEKLTKPMTRSDTISYYLDLMEELQVPDRIQYRKLELESESFDSESGYSIPVLSVAYLIEEYPKQAMHLLDCCTDTPVVTGEDVIAVNKGDRETYSRKKVDLSKRDAMLPTNMPGDSPYWWGFSSHDGIISHFFSRLNLKHDAFPLCSRDVVWDAIEALDLQVDAMEALDLNSKRIVNLWHDVKMSVGSATKERMKRSQRKGTRIKKIE